jgi:lauroyl/myristoyl acyltransferase
MQADAVTSAKSSESSSQWTGVSLWQRLSFSTTRACLWLLLRVFSLRGLYVLGQAFGTLEWLINYKRRRRFRRALKAVAGDTLTGRQRRRHARRFFRRTRCDKIFYLIFDRIPRKQALARFQIGGQELLDKTVEQGRACFVALSHFGSHHVAAMLMTLRGYKVAGVRDPHEGGIRRYMQSLYDERYPEVGRMQVISSDAYPRDIYRCFQDGYVLGAALDVHRLRNERKRTARVRQFGQERDYVVGTVQIALRCGADVIQGFVVSEKDFRYRLDLLGPLVEDSATAESPEGLQQIMQTYADNIETYLTKYPDHMSRA